MKKQSGKKWLSVMLAVCMVFGSMSAAFPLKTEAAQVTRRMANVVVFVNFKDTDHSSHSAGRCYVKEGNAQLTRDLFDGSTETPRALKQYLKNISYGQLEVENIFPQMNGDVLVPYTLERNLKDYLDSGTNMDHYIIQEVISQLEQSKTLTQNPSLDGDGFIDNLMIVVPCESGTNNTALIGHQANYGGYGKLSQYSGGQAVREYSVGSYIILPEDSTYTLAHPAVLNHEFLHAVGYPDLYRQTNPSGQENPVGVWDIMGAAGRHPNYPLAYLRSAVTGWFQIPTVATSQKGYSLYAASAATEDVKDQQAVILRTSYSDTEFFVLEYRKKGTDINHSYDYLLPDSGLIIYRVDTRYWGNHTDDGDMIYVMRPGDEYDSRGRERGLNVYDACLSETSYGSSDPNKSLEDNAIVYSDGTNSGIVISNIGKAGGDQITFDINFTEGLQDGYWTTMGTQDGVYEMSSYMDTDGAVYSLLRTGSGVDAPVSLYRYDASGWNPYSSVPIQNVAYDFRLVKYGGSFYAGYLDRNSYRLKLDQWTGSAWRNVYTSSASSYSFAMTAASDGIYLSYTDTSGQNLYAYRYSSSGTEQLGARVSQGDGLSNPSIAAENGMTAVMYRDRSEDLHVKTYDSSARTWKDAGTLSLKGGYGQIKLYKNKIYLLRTGRWEESISDLYQYDLSAADADWKQVGNGPFANENLSEVDLCFYGDDPHIAYLGSTSKAVWVKNVVNGSWTTLGSKVANELVSGLGVFVHGGKIYAAYYNSGMSLGYIRSHTVNSSGSAPDGGTNGGNSGGTTGGSNGGSSGGTTGGSNGGSSGGTSGGSNGGSSGGTTGGSNGGNSGGTSGGSNEGSSGGTTGGSNGGSSGGTTGGSNGGSSGGTTGGSNGGNSGGTTGGSNGGNSGSTSGGSSGGNSGNTSGGSSGGNSGSTSGSTSGGNTVQPSVPSQPVDKSGIQNLRVSQLKSTTLQLNWTPVSGAVSYEIYYSTSRDSGYKRLANAKTSSYKFTRAKCGATYYFKIRTVSKSGKKKVYGELSLPVSGMTVLNGAPYVYVSKTTYNSVTIKWSKVQDAKKYEIYYSTSPNGGYRLLKTQGGTSFTHKGLQTGAVYYYQVRPVRDYYKGSLSNQTSARTVLGNVTNLKVSASGTDKMKVSWKKVPGVSYYVILRSDSPYGAYQQIGTSSKTSFIDTGLTEGTFYYYKVYAVAGPYKTNEAGPTGQMTKINKK